MGKIRKRRSQISPQMRQSKQWVQCPVCRSKKRKQDEAQQQEQMKRRTSLSRRISRRRRTHKNQFEVDECVKPNYGAADLARSGMLSKASITVGRNCVGLQSAQKQGK